jgi:nucleotide-binding universal stress UspA family protein
MRFLVATDGSEAAENALAYATDVSDAVGGAITVVYAVDPAVYERSESTRGSGDSDAERRLIIENVEDAEERGIEILEAAAELAADLGQDVETELLYGNPVPEITDYAEEKGFDTIVVGHRGRSAHTDRMIGSVAKDVVERATVPVTVVR